MDAGVREDVKLKLRREEEESRRRAEKAAADEQRKAAAAAKENLRKRAKARANALLGYSPPFDRHDWVVTRCGKEVTYLIDFYNGKPTPGRPVAMHIDARPAADDWQGAWDRVRMRKRARLERHLARGIPLEVHLTLRRCLVNLAPAAFVRLWHTVRPA